ncbi:DUF1003 domain-containing protein [Haladaptatus salinisoli]|uniref:DUF1003 domain-containing protein n=1 Tax=Haladaptatus salinisoli TaxID=2884876 RepID=UPI001D09FA12|nr:DUF1003 domain-containing protein [Haladaptatus salinisoli]
MTSTDQTRNSGGESVVCPVCHQQKPGSQMVAAEFVHAPLRSLVRKDHPGWDETGVICTEDLHRYRLEHIRNLLAEDSADSLSSEEENVLGSLETNEIIAHDTEEEYQDRLTLGDRLSDRLSEFAGSWRFIILFVAFMAGWMVLNTVVLVSRAFDPYPFILLNLVLSTLAALQAPVIMMSQNRQEDRDRVRAENDYEVNLKSELEVKRINDKLDHLLTQQWQRLLEIQETQAELIDELSSDNETG